MTPTAAKAPRRKPERREQALHIACVDFMRRCVPAPPEGPFFFHPYNGGYRTPREAALGKALGVRAGVSDIILFWHGRPVAIELKSKDGRVSLDQLGAQAEMRMAGAVVYPDCRSLDAFQDILDVLGVPMRGRLAA